MASTLLRLATLLAAALFLSLPANAQEQLQTVPSDWVHLDLEQDGFAGISTYRAYEELLRGRAPRRSVIVAVIDSGVDTTHAGLAGRLWINPYATSTDRGYFGDRYGWSFLGNSDGENVEHDTFEYAREYARLKPRFAEAEPEALDEQERDKYAYFTSVRDSLHAKRAEYQYYVEMLEMADMARRMAHQELSRHFGTEDYAVEQVRAIKLADPQLLQAQEIALFLDANNLTEESLAEQAEYIQGMLTYALDPDFDPRPIVGDDYDDLTERYYGSADVHGPDPSHGTGVAGIIAGMFEGEEAAVRGVAADSVFIMAIRAVPQGDERDKDVANAIRYAVDNGAHVINMSFGKPLSPQKQVVDEAVRHAMENGVLMVHAAGNDSRDLTSTPSFPSRLLDDGSEAELWIEVGASTALPDALAASFSNYGQGVVDVFAPGENVLSLKPGDTTDRSSGTSFAAPHVAGLAALLMSHYPELTPAEVRKIILETALPLGELEVLRPGSETQTVSFGSLSTTGGLINAYRAVERAEEITTPPSQ